MVPRSTLLRVLRTPTPSPSRTLSSSAAASAGAALVSRRSHVILSSYSQHAPPLAARCFATSAPRLFSRTGVTHHQAKLTAETYPGLKRGEGYSALTGEHVAYFRELLGGEAAAALIDGVNADAAEDIQPFNEDWMHKYRGQAKLVLKPASTEEVRGNTGLVGGSVPVFDEIVINMSRMNKIHSFDEVSGSLLLDAGVILEVADQYLAQKGYIFPLDLGAKGSCHVGGNVATNAGGLRLLRYGSLHGSVLGMEAVLPDGTVMDDLCTLRKNNTGYDLKQLFIGAEGTIGIITKLVIQCPQRSSAVNVAFLGLESFEKAQLAFREAKKQLGEILSAFELMDSKSQQLVHRVKQENKPLDGEHPFYCLIETSGSNGDHDYEKLEKFLEDVMGKEIVADGVVAQDDTQVKSLWSWRESIPECIGHWGGVYKYDVSIPLSQMYSLVDDVKARMETAGLIGDSDEHPVLGVVGYGHMGDSNLHLNVAVRWYDAKVEKALEPFVYEWIEARKGSISAEHGLGLAKKNYIKYSRNEAMIGLMKQIKDLYDPSQPYRRTSQSATKVALRVSPTKLSATRDPDILFDALVGRGEDAIANRGPEARLLAPELGISIEGAFDVKIGRSLWGCQFFLIQDGTMVLSSPDYLTGGLFSSSLHIYNLPVEMVTDGGGKKERLFARNVQSSSFEEPSAAENIILPFDMVGVPGKYKGCETCRRRRVKCSNERPSCKTCINGGRECEGYERERVFITGTPENKGRVASHPKKSTPPRKPKSDSSSNMPIEQGTPQIVPLSPLTSAWDDYTRLANQGVEFPALVTAVQTNLAGVVRHDFDEFDGTSSASFGIQLPPYSTADLQPVVDGAYGMNAQCIVRQKATDTEHDPTESYCAFLFEHDGSGTPSRLTADQVANLGPRHFSSFPNHHFFVRVYRPVAASLALIGRKETFLSSAEWLTLPWEQHPKSLLDQLFDIVLQLPALFAETDQIMPLQATLTRRAHAQELLHHSLLLESRFRQWLQEACRGTEEYPYPFWAEELRSPGGAIPFANAYAFKDAHTSLMFLYYWMSQIPFHRCIENLHMAIFQPVVDTYPNMWPDLPQNLQIDPTHYQDGRELAANICRGLDSALDATVQPDILVAPMTVALDFYRDINATSQDGVLEILWLDGFRKRLVSKSQAVASVLQVHRWVEIARF
ncbi:Actin-interacting protein 2 [Cladobotryum mycophilum]|uniref:Actin-interacting protein 2 n=1 Tax=Cladobotryum mycophilum TaxID=491253 RepID=A0ABR0SD83_9HYPO